MKYRIVIALLAALFVAALPSMVSAQDAAAEPGAAPPETVFNDITGPTLVGILQRQGFAASLTTDSYGDPLIIAQAGGMHFSIVTYGCNGDAEPACQRLQMIANFRLPQGASEYDIALMNAYNQRFLFGRAYIDAEGNATVDYTINLSQGISGDNIIDDLIIWIHVLDNFSAGVSRGETS